MPVQNFDNEVVWKQHLIYLLVAILIVGVALAFYLILDHCIFAK